MSLLNKCTPMKAWRTELLRMVMSPSMLLVRKNAPSKVRAPPRSLELDPVENVWQFLRDIWLTNRGFYPNDDIVDDLSPFASGP